MTPALVIMSGRIHSAVSHPHVINYTNHYIYFCNTNIYLHGQQAFIPCIFPTLQVPQEYPYLCMLVTASQPICLTVLLVTLRCGKATVYYMQRMAAGAMLWTWVWWSFFSVHIPCYLPHPHPPSTFTGRHNRLLWWRQCLHHLVYEK